MTFGEVNTRIDQPMEHDIDRGIRGLINPFIHWNGKSLTVLLYDIKLNSADFVPQTPLSAIINLIVYRK